MKCRFCEIVSGDLAGEEVIYEDDRFLVLTDRYRVTSVGSICLIIPKAHCESILEIPNSYAEDLLKLIKMISQAMQQAYACQGIRLWTAVNREAGQSIFHCHIHVLPCRTFFDRVIAAFPGFIDLKRKLLGKRGRKPKRHSDLAEKLRKAIAKN